MLTPSCLPCYVGLYVSAVTVVANSPREHSLSVTPTLPGVTNPTTWMVRSGSGQMSPRVARWEP